MGVGDLLAPPERLALKLRVTQAVAEAEGEGKREVDGLRVKAEESEDERVGEAPEEAEKETLGEALRKDERLPLPVTDGLFDINVERVLVAQEVGSNEVEEVLDGRPEVEGEPVCVTLRSGERDGEGEREGVTEPQAEVDAEAVAEPPRPLLTVPLTLGLGVKLREIKGELETEAQCVGVVDTQPVVLPRAEAVVLRLPEGLTVEVAQLDPLPLGVAQALPLRPDAVVVTEAPIDKEAEAQYEGLAVNEAETQPLAVPLLDRDNENESVGLGVALRQAEGVEVLEVLPLPRPLREGEEDREGERDGERLPKELVVSCGETVPEGEGEGDCETEALAATLPLAQPLGRAESVATNMEGDTVLVAKEVRVCVSEADTERLERALRELDALLD